jgi:hypothetical protein
LVLNNDELFKLWKGKEREGLCLPHPPHGATLQFFTARQSCEAQGSSNFLYLSGPTSASQTENEAFEGQKSSEACKQKKPPTSRVRTELPYFVYLRMMKGNL